MHRAGTRGCSTPIPAGRTASASYTLAADDLYVRARVESNESATYPNAISKMHPPMKVGWTQPYRQHALFSNPGAVNTSAALSPQQRVNSDNLRGTLPDYDWYAEGSKVNQDLPIGKLRNYTGIMTFDLPSDAQWEFACLGGTAQPQFGVGNDLPKYAWYGKIKTNVQPVGLLLPNPYGLYDILGNGSELCNDWYGEGSDYAVEGVLQIDPKGPANDGNNNHVVHAASWDHGADYQRACARSSGLIIGQTILTSYATYRLICGIDMK